jgi:hypothetical protein
MTHYSFSGNRAPWWVRLLTVMVGMVLLVGLFFFAIFAFIAVAILGASGMVFLWWQKRKMRKSPNQDIVVTQYREIHQTPLLSIERNSSIPERVRAPLHLLKIMLESLRSTR